MSAATKLNSLFSVAGKNVLVTGGSRGIGLMIAKGFVDAGAKVLLTSRDEKACAEAAESLKSDNVQYVASNVSTREGCVALASHTASVFDNKLDVLVNNAGASWGEPLDRDSGKANWGFDKVFDLNVKGLFYLTRECIPLLKRETGDDPGRVINIGSVAGMVPQEAPTHAYDASKAAVHHLTKDLARELAPKHITVNVLAPGFVPSRMSAGLATWGGDAQALANKIPLGRMGEEDDMAGAAIFLSSKASSWCTGVILNVDGGTVGAMPIPLSSL
ncbi:Diacetyl reductase [(S)-acetoin forming] [Seminavis robusta]|uniref:Diacetyl reductase [(S)-acetoin forming] n=1 Tax=Seminavis robusta TaxID=568900 RepID=A0A9N8DAR0_9STRA|nr:Diacetyl reductase [(S)-acetoin forming] [Seminavis robusta]|eukprot:Sro37_g023280.1 Diacetyl reductase [(S)-acetoin forming] (274) ;mRNA; r:96067-97158